MTIKQAVVIGINHYAAASSLRYAINDADEFASALELPEYDFDTQRLLDTAATTEQVTSHVSSLLGGPAAIKLLFFAGHGWTDDKGIYLATADGSVEEPGVNLDWIRGQVLAAKNTVILILDSCHSGAATLRNRAIYRAMSETDIDLSFNSLGSGKILLAACGSDETTPESSDFRHGVFTHHLLEGMIGSASNIRGIVTPIGLFDYVATKCEEDGYNKPIFKGEQAGAVIMGSGFSPIPGLNLQANAPEYASASQNVIDQLEQEAIIHLDDYLENTSMPYERWKTEGYRTATKLLEPIMRWFDRTVSETPEVMSRQRFGDAYSEAKARLSQLGSVSEGTFTEEGQIVKRLGSGAFGTVWEVSQSDGLKLAYKIYHPQEIEVREKVARFGRGYRAMRQLEHPHIVKVYGETKCPLGFYMDLINGPNLRDFIGNELDTAEVLELLIKIAETLQHAHGRNVIHRDVKPENIVLQYDTDTSTWVPFLTDFDLAWFSSATQLTKEAFGAIYYASPEQLAKPSSRVAHAATTDVYSFGQLCYFVATGSDPVPFGVADNISALKDRIGGWPVAQSANIFAGLYESCVKQDPGHRVGDFRTVIDALFEALTLVKQTDLDEQIGPERFVTELCYALADLSDDRHGIQESFDSLSGRSRITVTDVRVGPHGLDVTLSIEQGLITLAGATAESARRRLNARLDRAMQGYANVSRRPGTQGTYQVYLDVKDMLRTLRGVGQCRSIISRAIDAIESL